MLISFVLFFLLFAAFLAIRTIRFGIRTEEPVPPAGTIRVDSRAAAARLAEALRLRTVSRPEPERYDRAGFQELHDLLAQNYPRVHAGLRRDTVADLSLLFTWPGTDPHLRPVLLMAHQDVVPIAPGTEKDWTHPPFAGTIDGGYIWGRGALDMKSTLTAILEAIENLLAEGFRPPRTVFLAFGHDEEVGGRGNRAIAESLASRGVRLEFVLDEGGIVLDGGVPGLRGAAALIGIAEKGYVTLHLTAHGEGGHSSMPPRPSAAGLLSRAICRLESRPFPVKLDFTRRMFEHLGPALSWPVRAVFANLWLFAPLASRLLSRSSTTEAGIRTTLAATVLRAGEKENVLPQAADAMINVRLMPGETAAGAAERVRTVIGDARVRVEPGPVHSAPSPVSRVDTHAFRLLRRIILQTAGPTPLSVAPYLVVGATDSRHFTEIAEDVYRFLFLRLAPSDLKRIHGTDERISITNYGEMIRFYYRLFTSLASDLPPDRHR